MEEHIEVNTSILPISQKLNTINTSSSLQCEDDSQQFPVEIQKPSIPNTSMEESPFMNITLNRKVKKKKIQSKLIFGKHKYCADKKQKSDTDCLVKNDCTEYKFESSSSCENIMDGENILVSHENKFICPLCWKQFEKKDTHISHMKMCAGKHNITIKKLLDAVGLQSKQHEERKALGLPGIPSLYNNRKTTSIKKAMKTNDGIDPDLQLGLALSVSMKEAEEEELLKEQEIYIENEMDIDPYNSAVLLERFGFTSTKPVMTPVNPKSKPASRLKQKCASLLMTRSKEERERLITEKVAIILMGDEDNCKQGSLLEFTISTPCIGVLSSTNLTKIQNKDCILWMKASRMPAEEDKHLYYVKKLGDYVCPSKVQVGDKIGHLSQMPFRLISPEKRCLEKRVEENVKDISRGLHSDSTCQDKDIQNLTCNSKNSSVYLNSDTFPNGSSFLRDLSCKWKCLLNNEFMSNIKIYVKNSHIIYAHELVLYVRCPRILHDIQEGSYKSDSKWKCLMWNNVSYQSALAFLEFIYCGTCNKITKLQQLESVVTLARTYELVDLHNHLKLISKVRNKMITEHVSVIENDGSKTSDVLVSTEICKSGKQNIHQHSSVVNSMLRTPAKSLEIPHNSILESAYTTHKQNSDKYNISNESTKSPDPFSESSDNYEKDISSTTTQQKIHCQLQSLETSLPSEKDSVLKEYNKIQRISPVLDAPVSSSSMKKSPLLQRSLPDEKDLLKITFDNKRKYAKVDSNDEERHCKKYCARKNLLETLSCQSDTDMVREVVTLDLTQSSEEEIQISLTQSLNPENKTVISNRELHASPICEEVELPDKHMHNSTENVHNEEAAYLEDLCANSEYDNFCYDLKYSRESNADQVIKKQSSPNKRVIRDSQEQNSTSPYKLSHVGLSKSLSHHNLYSPENRNENSSSPILIKCLSQNSIHLRNGNDVIEQVITMDKSDSEQTPKKVPEDITNTNCHELFTPTHRSRESGRQSVSSFKCLLEDSFMDELGRSSLWKKNIDNLASPIAATCSISNEKKFSLLKTPTQQTVNDNIVTPMADYSAMKTPILKKELQKYGLKPLKRKQATLILKHIYDELHPWIPISSSDIQETKSNEVIQHKGDDNVNVENSSLKEIHSLMEENTKNNNSHSQNSEVQDEEIGLDSSFSSQQSIGSSQSDYLQSEEVDEIGLTQTSAEDIPVLFNEYLRSNPQFHKEILLYKPINLEDLHDALKTKNNKLKLKSLIEYLDEQCITFRTQQRRNQKKNKKS